MLVAALFEIVVNVVLPPSRRQICRSYRPFASADSRFHLLILAFQQLANILGVLSNHWSFHSFANALRFPTRLYDCFQHFVASFLQKGG
jgi:hypothetical protein